MARTTAAIALLCLFAIPVSADTPQLPIGVTCEAVRAKVAEHGRIMAYAWARLNGYSAKQIAEAKRCLVR
jgi:hypothetical protein